VVVKVFNTLGLEVRKLVDLQYPAGSHLLTWDGRDNTGRPVSSGIYFYQLRAGDFAQVRKMNLLR
jgi:flagellar hook assembly protein FlgD